ncbi:MAG: xanthine dehydrogenase family protein molybdopterin-binding subunit, partial [Longimicrobiales bacterium]
LRSGSKAHGQGHETTFAQIVADELGIHPDDVDVRQGDSADAPGVGSFASRSLTIGGSAAKLAARELHDRVLQVAALLLEVAVVDVEWADGRARVRGAPARAADLAELAAFVQRSGDRLPLDLQGGLVADVTFSLPGPVFPSGAYAAEVEIDPETGVVDVQRIVAVDDAGRVVNPLLADGQVQGAVVQGLGESLMEEVVHDEAGQPLTASFVEYAVPSAMEVPPIDIQAIETPSPFNPLGAKGIGEGGAIGTPVAIANAVCRALAPLGIRHLDLPFTPERVFVAIRDARER